MTTWNNSFATHTRKSLESRMVSYAVNCRGTQAMNTEWREDYLNTKAGLSKRQTQLLTNGADSLASSWILQAMYIDWKRIKGIKTPPAPNLQSSYKEFIRNK